MAMINMSKLSEERCRYVFDQFDTDGDNSISLREFKQQVLTSNVAEQLPPHFIPDILRKADLDADGTLSFQEFCQMVNNPELTPQQRTFVRRFLGSYYNFATHFVLPKSAIDQIDNYEDHYSCVPPPFFIILMSFIELGVFIGYAVKMNEPITATGPVPIKSPLIYNPYRRYEAWRYLSYMLIHVGYFHIIGNLIMQILLGIPLEMVHKFWRIMIIYFCGVIAGSLGTSVSDPYVYLAGASGGVYALITAHVANIIMNFRDMKFAIYQLIGFLLYIIIDVAVSIYTRYAGTSEQKVGYAAHFAGGLAGLLIGIGVLRNMEWQKWEKYLWWASIALFTLLMSGAIAWNIFYTDYFPPSDKTPV